MSLADQILAALDTLAREERERAELGGRLMAEVQEAADELQTALVPILGHVTVGTSVPRSASVLGGHAVMDGEALVSGADVHLRVRGSTLIALCWRPTQAGSKRVRSQADKIAGEKAAHAAYHAAIKTGATRDDAIAVSRKAWGEAAYASDAVEAAKCWAITDATGDCYPTALVALRAGLERPETARQVAEVVTRLRGQVKPGVGV